MRAWIRSLLLLAVALSAGPAVAKPKAKAQLVLQVKPAGARVYIDNHDMGEASAGRTIDLSAGVHVIRLVYKGDEREEPIKFEAGRKTTYSVHFDEEPKGGKSADDDLDLPGSVDSP